MDPYTALPPNIVREDLLSTSKINEDNLRLSVRKLNEISGDYRKTLSLIDEKVIYLSAGSISLFLTFLGILFNSSRDVSGVQYVFIFISIFAFLATIVLLLLARWIWSLYLFSIAHRHYLNNLKAKHLTEAQLMRSGGNIINNTDYGQMSQEDIEKNAKKLDKQIKKIEKQIKIDEKKEKTYSGRAKILALMAYGFIVFAYIFATLFFIGLVNVMTASR